MEILDDRPERAGISEILAAALITLVQIPVGFVFTIILDLLSLQSGACGDYNCNFAAGFASTHIPMVVGAVVLVLTIVLIVVRAIRGGALWPTPVLGLAVITVAFVIAAIINNISFTPSS